VDEIAGAESPPRVADAQARQMAVARRHLESLALETDRAVAASWRAIDLGAEGAAELRAARARATHVRAGQIPLERRAAELAMPGAVVFQLDPRLRGCVQPLEREVRLALEHREQPPFHLGPEDLLLRVLVGAVRQRGLVD